MNNPAAGGSPAERQWRLFFYAQDTWRVTPKLTVNYGLRVGTLLAEKVNGKGNGGFANIVDNGNHGGIRVAGFGKYGLNGNISNDLKAFAPRLGIAYQLTRKTVLRAGYGRSYDIGVFGSNFGHTVTQNLPVLLKQNIDASTADYSAPIANLIPIFHLDDGPQRSGLRPDSLGWIYPADKALNATHIRPIRAGFAHGRCVELHGATSAQPARCPSKSRTWVARVPTASLVTDRTTIKPCRRRTRNQICGR